LFGEVPIDFQRAKELMQRVRQGEQLTPDDQAYLDRARAAREHPAGRAKTPPNPAVPGAPPEASQDAGLAGDDAHQRSRVPGVKIPTDLSPVTKITAKAADEQPVRAYYRKPPGEGPFPAMICLHGGVESVSDRELEDLLLRNPTYTRFLARGYVVIGGDYRSYTATPKARGPILDCLALTEAVKQLPFVDRESVVIFGGSGGGSLALETAASTSLAAIVCGEPATVLFCGMLEDGEFGRRMAILQNPRERYTPERQATTREKIKQIKCPVMILDGDKHVLKTLNQEIFLPELKAAGVDVLYQIYPGNPHGFYWGSGTTEKTVEQFMADIDAFLAGRLKTPPKAIAL